jgi:hypothetical protein
MADFSGNEIFEWNLLFNGEEMVFKDMTANRYTVPLIRIPLDDADRDTCYKSLMPYISNHEIDPPVSPYKETEPAPAPQTVTQVTPAATATAAPETGAAAVPDLPFQNPGSDTAGTPGNNSNDINELYNFL